jgi:hypothetical protein
MNFLQKTSYGFDCGSIYSEIIKKITNPLTHFIPECISNDNRFYSGQDSSGKASTFDEQIKKLNLENKKIFIKMDIEGAEFDALTDIIKKPENIAGILVKIHFLTKRKYSIKTAKLLEKLQEHFYLVHMHTNNCTSRILETMHLSSPISDVIELSHINKNLESKAQFIKEISYPTKMDSPNHPDFKYKIIH